MTREEVTESVWGALNVVLDRYGLSVLQEHRDIADAMVDTVMSEVARAGREDEFKRLQEALQTARSEVAAYQRSQVQNDTSFATMRASLDSWRGKAAELEAALVQQKGAE